MDEPAVVQEKGVRAWDAERSAEPGGKEHASLASLLKHSCLLCWSSSPRDKDELEMDERVVGKTAEIRELETAVAVENLELKEQQSDRKELEETLEKLEKHKEKLIQQIKATRQLCYEESQQILSLQAEEAVRENQVEEYEKELARARWRLRKLREEVKQAKRKVQEAGERDVPLQDSIRQSYEEILQEENTLCSLSGSAVTPQSQMEGSSSPGDTTEDEPIPVRPWGRSQSLPAYADLIMGANDPAFCHNLADTREEVDDSGSSSPKMDRSDMEDSLEEAELEKQLPHTEATAIGLDFYQADPFAHCQGGHDLFNEDLFPKTDSSDGFTSDPFKGSDPFGADVLFPEGSQHADPGQDPGPDPGPDEADRSLSCAENKASTGTQCFESEFPDEDSDIEISYSREDLEMAGQTEEDQGGFRPIQSSSEELGPVPIRGWRSQGQYSGESDPNGYELDLGNISPPSDIEELSLGSVGGVGEDLGSVGGVGEDLGSVGGVGEDLGSVGGVGEDLGSVGGVGEDLGSVGGVGEDLGSVGGVGEDLGSVGGVGEALGSVGGVGEDAAGSATPSSPITSQPQRSGSEAGLRSGAHSPVTPAQDSQAFFHQSELRELSFDMNFEPSSLQSSYDPYGFKLSPEHSSHTLLDPDEAPSPSTSEPDLAYDPEPLTSPPNFDPFASHACDPYGFKLSPEEINQEVLDFAASPGNEENVADFHNDERVDLNFSNQEVAEDELLVDYENQEVLEPMNLNDVKDGTEAVDEENQELLDFAPENQEVLDVFFNSDPVVEYENKEVLEPCSPAPPEPRFDDTLIMTPNQEVPDLEQSSNREEKLIDFNDMENQEVVSHDNHMFLNQEVPDTDPDGNQEVLLRKEANNNQLRSSSNSSDSDAEHTGVRPRGGGSEGCKGVPMGHRGALMEDDLGEVFRQGGYVGCPDVADDLEPLVRRAAPASEPVRPVRPVRPPRPSLRGKDKGIDLK